MTSALFLIFEILGTVAFAVSGALVGISKKMDIFGIIVLAVSVAVGGGIIRDLILGSTPPSAFVDPSYALLAAVCAVVFCFPFVQRLLAKHKAFGDRVFLVMDTLGLASFAVVGVQTAYSLYPEASFFLPAFAGVVTGVGGGVIRDVFAGVVPGIFVRQFYASAVIAGSVLCVLLWNRLGAAAASAVCMLSVVLLRFFAEKYHWHLVHPK